MKCSICCAKIETNDLNDKNIVKTYSVLHWMEYAEGKSDEYAHKECYDKEENSVRAFGKNRKYNE